MLEKARNMGLFEYDSMNITETELTELVPSPDALHLAPIGIPALRQPLKPLGNQRLVGRLHFFNEERTIYHLIPFSG